MQKLVDFLSSLRQLERKLFSYVLMSFAVSSLGLVVEWDKFSPAFKALSELLAGTMGVAAILTVYISSFGHPAEELDDLLDSRPVAFAVNVFFGFIFCAGMFYLFYTEAQSSRSICLLPLCAGVYMFFVTFAGALLKIQLAERQTQVWAKLSPEFQLRWIERQKGLTKFMREAKKVGDKADALVDESRRTIRRVRWEGWKVRFRLFFRNLWASSYPIRKKLHLVSWREEFEIEQAHQRLRAEAEQENVALIRAGKVRPLALEGTDLKVYEVSGRCYFDLDGEVNQRAAQDLIRQLEGVGQRPEGSRCALVALLAPACHLTYQAREAFSASSVALHEELQSKPDRADSASA